MEDGEADEVFEGGELVVVVVGARDGGEEEEGSLDAGGDVFVVDFEDLVEGVVGDAGAGGKVFPFHEGVVKGGLGDLLVLGHVAEKGHGEALGFGFLFEHKLVHKLSVMKSIGVLPGRVECFYRSFP